MNSDIKMFLTTFHTDHEDIMSSSKLSGSCNCGAFKYEITEQFKLVINCHCAMCQKGMGAAFLTAILVPKAHLNFLENSKDATYKSTEGVTRHFCSVCGGCTFIEEDKLGNMVVIYGGTLDGDLGTAIAGECYVNYKAPFHRLYDGVPRCGEAELGEGFVPQ